MCGTLFSMNVPQNKKRSVFNYESNLYQNQYPPI